MRRTRFAKLSAFALLVTAFILLANPVVAAYPFTSQPRLGVRGNGPEAHFSNATSNANPARAAGFVEAAADFWSPAASMNFARFGATATLLDSGKVLMVGGTDGSALDKVELYDPLNSTWAPAASLSAPRGSHTSTLLNSGKVLVAGGCLEGAELYDPDSDTWTAAGTITRRGTPVATLLPSGKVLVAGGWDCSGSNAGLSSAELYDPVTNTWSPAANMSVRRGDFASTILPSGKVLVMGGFSLDGRGGMSSAELYDPETNTWSPAASMSTPRESHSATLLPSGKVLVAGGGTTIHPMLSSAELYDPASNTWSPAANMKTARAYHSAVLLYSGKVLVSGGGGGSNCSTTLASAELYDPASNTWSPLPNMSRARINHTAVRLASGQVLVAGGQVIGGNNAFATAELFKSGFTISGHVAQSDGTPVSGVTLSIGTARVMSDSSGNYAASGFDAGEYTISPALPGYQFTPAYRDVTVAGDMTGQDFTAVSLNPWTLIYYLAGDSDDNMAAATAGMINKLRKAAQSNPNVEITAFLDQPGNKSAAYYHFSNSESHSIPVEVPPTVPGVPNLDIDSGKPETLRNFVSWSATNYPSQHYALFIVDHGGLIGTAIDYHLEDGELLPKGKLSFLTPAEIKIALSPTPTPMPHLDIVRIDACLMGTIEAAYSFADVADYYVAGEAIGFIKYYPDDYINGNDIIGLPAIGSDTTPLNLAKAIAASYSHRANPYTVSIMTLSNIKALAESVHQFARLVGSNMNENQAVLTSIGLDVQRFDSDGNWKIEGSVDNLVDLGDFARLAEERFSDPAIKAAAADIQAKLGSVVPPEHNAANQGEECAWVSLFPFSRICYNHAKANGISIFFPPPNQKHPYYTSSMFDFVNDPNWDTGQGIQPAAEDGGWGTMLAQYVYTVAPDAPDAAPTEPIAPVTTPNLVYIPLNVR